MWDRVVDERQTVALLRPPNVVAVALPVHRPHDPVEPDWPNREEEVKEFRPLLVPVVDVLLAAALHAVLRLSLLAVDVVAWWALLQLLPHFQRPNEPVDRVCRSLSAYQLWAPALDTWLRHALLVVLPLLLEECIQP